jgi:hypothetical protein
LYSRISSFFVFIKFIYAVALPSFRSINLKNNNMKRKIFLALALIILGVASVKAQVVVGNSQGSLTPHAGAILDVQSAPYTVGGTTYQGKGLLLPRVQLTDVNTFGLSGGNQDEAVGMLIYQDGDAIDKGIYLWTKETGLPGKWKLIASVE